MPDGSSALTLTLHQAIADIQAADWNACARRIASLMMSLDGLERA